MKNVLPYVNQPCERCGSKKKIARTWKETIPTFTGTTEVEYSQIVCTNATCQKLFDEIIEQEAKKREAIRLQREQRDIERKNKLLKYRKESKKKN